MTTPGNHVVEVPGEPARGITPPPRRFALVDRLVNRPPLRRGRWLVRLTSAWLVLIVLLAIVAPLLPLAAPNALVGPPRMAPFTSIHLPLGTDTLGRSQLSRIIYGGRVSITVGAVATSVGVVLGLALGLVAGYFRGKVERVFDFLMDTLLAFPPLILLLALTSVLTPSLTSLVLALSFLAIPGFARVARASTIMFASREFVDASRVLGAGAWRIMLRELLPNVIMPVAGIAFIGVAALTVAEGSLSFLGLGIPPPTPSWGGMMAAGRNDLATAPGLVLIPSAMLFLTVFSLNVVGDRIREKLDVRQQATT